MYGPINHLSTTTYQPINHMHTHTYSHNRYTPHDRRNYGGATLTVDCTILPYLPIVRWENPEPVMYVCVWCFSMDSLTDWLLL